MQASLGSQIHMQEQLAWKCTYLGELQELPQIRLTQDRRAAEPARELRARYPYQLRRGAQIRQDLFY